ncbi:outer membrane lipoprotein carrier protein LolA [Paenibacillus gansuensis]|uniref:Outer membrane lipoprotein carrier protein LolA n=1 Tax=Paenibacillus gansuensis TaxID=306542 RepID=A0ABW5P8K0_9BACL
MRKVAWILAMVMCVSVFLAACGTKDASGVVKDLEGKAKKLDSYQGSGTMKLYTGQQPQEYNVEVWYQQPHYYRISLTNEKKDISQIVLRNDDGVFVLTPHLNKSFRFQSNWPENQGQVYLYQTLVQSILMDQTRQFASDKEYYMFDVVANYQNGSLARQKIWLDKKNYAPQKVQVSDANANVVVEVNFNQFDFGKKFEKDSFSMQRNMTASSLESIPTLEEENEGTEPVVAGEQDGKGNNAAAGSSADNQADDPNAENSDAPAKDPNAENSDAPAKDPSGNASEEDGDSPQDADDTQGKADDAAKGNEEGTPSDKNDDATSKADEGQGTSAGEEDGQASKPDKTAQSMAVLEPEYLPEGVVKKDESQIKLGENNAVMMRYTGEYNYTLIQTVPQDHTVTSVPGKLLDLGYTFGVLTGTDMRTLIWTHNGSEFRLSSGELTDDDMIRIAQSVQGEIGK